MAQVVGTLIDQLLARVRDREGLANTRTFTRLRLQDCQRFINAALRQVTESVTLTTTGNRVAYPITANLPNCIRIDAVRQNNRDLVGLNDLSDLNHLNRSWFREIGTRYEAYTTVGRDLLMLYPTLRDDSSVEVRYTRLVGPLDSEDDATELPDEYLDAMLTLGEVILLAKQRDLDSATAALKRLVDRLQPDVLSQRAYVSGKMPMVGQPREIV